MAGSIERMTGCCAKTAAAESFSVCFCLGPSPSSSPSLLGFPTRSSRARLQSTQYGQCCGHNAMGMGGAGEVGRCVRVGEDGFHD